MTRNAKNGMSTGGRSSGGKSVRPISFDVRLMLAIRLPRTGTLTANRFVSDAASGMAISTSLAGCSSRQRPSIAANFAG